MASLKYAAIRGMFELLWASRLPALVRRGHDVACLFESAGGGRDGWVPRDGSLQVWAADADLRLWLVDASGGEGDWRLAQPLVQPGDLLVGLPSSGPHTNGYSLIRKVVGWMRLQYRSSNATAAEIIGWLDGEYRITDQIIQEQSGED